MNDVADIELRIEWDVDETEELEASYEKILNLESVKVKKDGKRKRKK
jgi:hypothetical protein